MRDKRSLQILLWIFHVIEIGDFSILPKALIRKDRVKWKKNQKRDM